jgi:predicted metal-dependent RNase
LKFEVTVYDTSYCDDSIKSRILSNISIDYLKVSDVVSVVVLGFVNAKWFALAAVVVGSPTYLLAHTIF